MRRALAPIALGLFLLATAPLAAAALFPEPHSPVQRQWQSMFMTVFWAALVIGLFVEFLILYALWRFRSRPGRPQRGPHIHGNTRMEIAWTIAPTVVMGWLLLISFQGLDLTDRGPTPDFYVEVTGSQFSWAFGYPDGTESSNGTMRVEQDKVVGLNVTATDVIHAFAVPQLGVMIDAVPGRTNHFWFQADAPGEYAAHCRELCNNEYRAGHGRMTAKVLVFGPGEQEKPWGWPAAAAAPPSGGNETGPPGSNRTGDERVIPVSLSPNRSFKLDPETITVAKGEAVAFEIKNDDAGAPHNFFIGAKYDAAKPNDGAEWLSGDPLKPGESGDLLVTFPDSDVTFEIWCDVPGHYGAGMKGTLTVGAGSGIAEGPKPLLPGFEPGFLLLGLAGVGFALARRRST